MRPDCQKTSPTLFSSSTDGSILKNMEGVTLDRSGRAICAERESTCTGNGSDDPIDLIVFAGRAVPKRFALMSDDETHLKAFVAVIPFPNAIIDRGCRLESGIGTPYRELTYIQGRDFEPNAEQTMDSQSYDEKHHDTGKAEADGSCFLAIMPNVVGKKSGRTVLEIKAKSCNPKLTFSVGRGHVSPRVT